MGGSAAQSASVTLQLDGHPHAFASVNEAIAWQARERPQKTAFVFLKDGETEAGRLDFGALHARAATIAEALSAQGARGERALLVFQNGLEFMAAFLGCLYAGTIPVPVYPPLSRRSHWQRLNDIAGDCQASWILATQDYLSDLDDHLEDLAALGVCERMPISLCAPIEYLVAPTGPVYMPGPTDIAFLQYTSGSTSAPKGVMVSHGNLLHNIGMMQQAFSHDQDSVLVSWLPLFHDMGLIGNVLQAACLGATCYVMTPAAFLQSPMRWLRALSRYRGTSSFAPDFAYELCVQRANDTELAGLDLSHWSMALNGAEPVRARTLQRFAETFAPCGFDARALYPGYGLAEGTLFAAGGGHLAGARTITLDAALFDAEGKVQCTEAATGRCMVASGRAWAGSRIAIVDAQTHRRCEDGEVGEIWLSGPSVCMGYWGRSDSRVATFCARIAGESDRDYLRTGDLGFMLDQDLFVAGRMKEVVILRGSNHYPQDLEAAVQSAVPALKPSGGAAFAMEIDGEERLVMVQEVERTRMRGLDAEAVFAGMRQALLQEFGVAAHGLVLIRPASLPKTSSGKIQRGRARDLFASGELDVLARWTAAPSSEAVAVPATEGWLRHLIDSVARHARIDVAGIAPECSIADLGMDSLSLAGVQHDLAALGASDVPMRVFFGDGRLSSIAAHLQQNAPPPAPARGIVTATDTVAAEGGMALSDNQRQLLLLDAVAAPGSAYHVPVCIRADFEPGLVRIALSALIQRHEVLRTRYRTELDGFSQHVEPAGDVDFQVEVAVGDDDAVVARLCSACRTPMDLSAGRVLRVLMLTPQRERQMADLLFVFHHIAVDLTSARLLIAEFGQTYAALAAGRLPAALPAAVPYRRFIEARQHRAFSPKGAADARYWAQVLADDTPLLQLPFDRARPALQTFRGSSLDVPLPGLRDGVRAAAARLGVTAHALLLSVYQLWLSRLSGQSDFLVAVPMSGRDDPGLAGCVGYCVAPAILKVQVVPGQTLVQLAHAQQLALAEAWDHQAGAMAALLARAERAGDRSAPPVFQSLFAYYTAERDALSPFGGGDNDTIRVGGLECQVRHLQATGAQLDLSLLVADNGESLCARVEFNSDLFDAATVARFGDSFATLLAAGCADPERAVQHLPMLSAQEAERVAGAWTTSAVDYAESRFLHELIDAQALDAPEAVALQIGDATMSREALRLASDRVAVQLQAHGVGPEDRVGIFLERSLEMVIALLGTLKAGAAYVPVDPELPAARRQAIVDAAGVAVLLVQNGLQESAAVHGIATLCVALAPDAATMSAPAPVTLADDNSAYLIYTSGSTGRPKGVVNTHGAIRNRILWMQQAYGLQCSDRVLQKTPFTFDVSVWEFFWPLIQGATLVVAAPGIHRDAEALGALMREQGVTHLHFVPSMLQAFLEVGAQDVPSLRQVYCSGEELPAPLVRRFAQAYPGVALHNLYGPTEAAVDVSYWPCGAEPDASRIPIGHPIANVQLYVLDRWMQPVPVGVAGELYIGGTGLARGYLGSPGLTAASFVPAPYGEPGARLYRSGDLARQRSDGAVEYLGRIDNQVKLRGFRIELGEVEAHLLAQPGVREAAAIVRADGTEPVLVAFVCGSMLQASALRMALTGLLPNYMVPTHICVLSAMPLSANGKIDRRALPAIELEREAQVAASTPRERALAAAWCSVLGLDSVGINERFFDLGGHSLLAAKLVAQLRSHHGLVLAVRDVFEAPTIAAQALRVQGTGEGGEEGARLVPVARGADAPLSAAQQRLWFLAQLDGPAATYNMPAAIVLHGALDVPALVQALQAVVARHEVLRSTYHERDGEPRQRVQPVEAFQVALEDCSQHPPAERDARVQQYVQAHAGTPFDLAVDLPIRAGVLRLGEQEHVLALCLHHIAGDGWSVGVLRRELSQAYQAARGQGPALEPLALQYIDYAHWQRSWLSEARQQAQLGYWQQQLAALPPLLELPTDRARPAVQSHRGGSLDVQLPAHLVGPLKQLAQSRQASLFMVLLAGFQAILARYSGQDDIAVGSPVANRPRAELEGLIGFFVNTLVLRAQVDPHTSFQSLLEQVRETTLAAYDHADVPFEQLVEVLQPARSLSHGPLFQVMFDLQHADTSDAMLSELRAEPLGDGLANAKFDLQLTLGEGDGQVSGTLQYAADLFDASSIARLWQHYVSLLEQAVASPQRRLDAVELLDESERQQLLVHWNQTGAQYPQATIHGLFQAQAARTPDAVAVYDGTEPLTYRALDEASTGLAQHLRALGVGTEDRVGICLPRDAQLLVALLAVLKAGAAYVPLDPQYPDVRIGHILDSAQPSVLLTVSTECARLAPLAGSQTQLLALDAVRPHHNSATALPTTLPGQLAYVIYTSGSTGLPKGVAITHANAVAMLDWARSTYPDPVLRHTLAATSICFDLSVYELFLPLLTGNSVVLVRDALALTEQAPPVAVSLINTVPSAMEALLAAHAVPASVRVVNLAGEALGRGLVERLYALGHVEAVYNLYGPSEDTTYSTGTLVDRGGADRPSIGRPLSNTRAYVLDEALRPVPVGVRGELYLTGAGLSRGYQGRAALTAERYLPNPFAGTPGERLYRTGDIVRYLADGRLDYLGRADHQVKLRGFRIELGEVEAALARQPGVREVVAVVQGQGSSQHLLAYASGDMLQGADLRRQLARELPGYMVPTQVIVLQALPLTANGKIDRRALPVGNTNAVSTYLAPRNEREKQIAAIWSDVLAIDAPSVDVSFFDLGGHSLLANRLVAALKRELAQDLRVRHIFDAPTIESLALLIGGQKHTPAGMVPMQQHGSGTPLFLIHPVGGDVLCYLPLVRAAGLQCAVHAIQRDELASGTPARYEDLRALAGRYLARIRNIQPLGPYRIAGWSMGGVIAAHIADLLQACGQQVEYLGIIDSFLRTPAEIADAALADDGTPEEAFQHMVQKLSTDAELRAHFDQSMHLDRLHSVLDPEELQRLRAITAAGVVAARRSPSVGLPVNAHYYCAAIPAGPHLDGKLDRHAQAGGNPARVRMLEGDHHSIMEPPQIHALAAAIAADIANGSPTQTATDADRAVMETL
ncbi:amino acid adenylation domain-containing protein [Stenotrophomonas forensis]|uniref:amino acid adenylation domain-containing protein n=1 Tax=Stenotrophomonas forensis TaxID=2871169 RepID=UPI0039C66D48